MGSGSCSGPPLSRGRRNNHHLLARVPRRRPRGLCRGRHHAQGRRPSDDLRRPCSLPGASFAHLPIYGLEDLVPGTARTAGRRGTHGGAGAFIAGRNTAPGGKLPLNINGGDLSYMHSGMYGMYALQESVRQMRGTAPRKSPAPKSRSATASAACSPPAARSSWRMSRLEREQLQVGLYARLGTL